MSNLSRVAWIAQMRLDLHHLLMAESFNSFDLRGLVGMMTGVNRSYVIRGLDVTGKTGLTISLNVADSLVLNHADQNGSFYLGLSDDPNVSITLPANQANVFVEATFVNQSEAPINTGFWDPLALTGESVSGTEFTASANSQNVLVLQISVNTIGFSAGAIPLVRAATNASSITSLRDWRTDMFRVGTPEDPLHKFQWSTARGEPVSDGTGVGNASDSTWRSLDGTGVLNDKGIGNFKDWADAVMTRIAEVAGIALWYQNGASVLPVINMSLSQLYVDTIGHNIQPNLTNTFKWTRSGGNLVLAGEGNVPLVSGVYPTGLTQWQFNYSGLSWHLGNTFVSGASRSYSDPHWVSPAPVDNGNVYLHLERDVPKGSGSPVKWADNSSYPTFNATKTVSGAGGDFTGIALGDYIRKTSEGALQYYLVQRMTDGTTIFDNATPSETNQVADSTIVAVELSLAIVSGTSTEPLRFFRSHYASSDIIADTISATYQFSDANYYWLGRRVTGSFYLRGYGTLQEGDEIPTLVQYPLQQGEGDLTIERAFGAIYDVSAGFSLEGGATTTLLTLRRRKRNNTVQTPGGGDNSAASLTYTMAAPVGLMSDGDGLWVRLSDTTGGALTPGLVTNATDDLNNTDTTTNTWDIVSAINNPLRTFDNKDVYLIARRTTIGGQPCLIFADGSVIDQIGQYINNNVDIQGTLRFSGAQRVNVGTVHTSNYTVLATDYLVQVDTSAAVATTIITLPASVAANQGQTVVVKDVGGQCNQAGKAIQIAPNGTDQIDGINAPLTLGIKKFSLTFIANQSGKWSIH